MDRTKIKQHLLGLLNSKDSMSLYISVEDIKDDTSLISDIALDSIQLLELIVEIENTFKISLNTEELSLDIFDRFSHLVDYIEAKVNNKTNKVEV